MDFGHLEQRKVPWSERHGAGNRNRTAAWDKRGVQDALADEGLGDYSRTNRIPDTTGRGGRTRSGPRPPTAEERRLIKKSQETEKALTEARKGSLPQSRVRAIERAANAAAKRVPKQFGGKRR
jgi:hypothetical protein